MARLTLNPGREKSLLRKHPWIFSRAIAKVEGDLELGQTVEVVNHKGQFICQAAFSPKSQIRARVWSFEQDEKINQDFFVKKIQKARNLREQEVAADTNGFRLIAAESDGLPGVTIDFYNGTLVVQLLSAGAEYQRDNILQALLAVFPNAPIFERSDVDVRSKEGLPQQKGWLANEQANTQTTITEHGIDIQLDINKGHKTGFYLDQRDSRHISGQYSQGKSVLNCFCYTGAFSLHALKAGATKVTNMDISANALKQAEKNHKLNDLLQADKVEFVKADVFKKLREYKEQGVKFDTIVMDPPKFVENKNQLQGACRGYKDINMLAFELLNEGGTLLTFSCSGLMEESLFQKIIADAALDAGKNGVIVEKLSQAKCHPIGLNYPEGFYLKGLAVKLV
ncbi:class I SAM-dependent methyltransferase [Catenovulum sp. SM1970]|uniref:class I SAM-dependent rRNA methyltransferase n=1 Tax=Marinifaba aquimaris TaxID=2741323 RepID=UPI001571CB84|nr:class I SAM-dependent methyltransferase [Marinifaba aquimaris]NTS76143.1 class I SAM-dependent methyltransferase [Marinifaba aquimaris]